MVDGVDVVRPQLIRVAHTSAALVLSAALVFLTACADRPGAQRAEAAAATAQGEGGSPYSIDSALTLFRSGLDPVAELHGGQPSIDALVTRFGDMVASRDTATMRTIVMTRREFAWLYYPTSPFVHPPTMQEPGLAWFLHLQHSQKGASRLLDRFGGRPMRIISNRCTDPLRQGSNTLWSDCVQRIVVQGDTVTTRLFAGVLERAGRFKIFSYSNDL